MHRCNLNIFVMDTWWEMQLGLPPEATREMRYAAFEETFPGLLTFKEEAAAHRIDDPNHGNTILLALGAEMFRTSDGEYDIKRMTIEQVGALTLPDYDANPHVEKLRQAILTAKARYGRVSNEGYSGLLHLHWMLRSGGLHRLL